MLQQAVARQRPDDDEEEEEEMETELMLMDDAIDAAQPAQHLPPQQQPAAASALPPASSASPAAVKPAFHALHAAHPQLNGHHISPQSPVRRWSSPSASPPSPPRSPPSPASPPPRRSTLSPPLSQHEHSAGHADPLSPTPAAHHDDDAQQQLHSSTSPPHANGDQLPAEDEGGGAAGEAAATGDVASVEEDGDAAEAAESAQDGSADVDADSPLIKRVKVYSLSDVGAWVDKGTGHVSVLHPAELQMTILVKAEDESASPAAAAAVAAAASSGSSTSSPSAPSSSPLTLLHHKIVDGQDYQRQGATIITWCELSTGLDLALSFQDSDGCGQVWQLITALQASCDARLLVPEQRSSLEPEEEAQLSLPSPSVAALPDIAAKLSAMTPAQKEYMAATLRDKAEQSGYVQQLFALHRDCELRYEAALLVLDAAPGNDDDAGDGSTSRERQQQQLEEAEEERAGCLSALEQLFVIGKSLFLLNEAAAIEWLVSEENMTDTVAMLEYEPAYSAPPSAPAASSSPSSSSPPPAAARHDYHYHRRLLSNTSFLTFSSLSSDPALPAKIRQSYYLQYVKDVLLLRHLDDGALSTLSSMLFLNSVMLISRMNERREWMAEVMQMMRDSGPEAAQHSAAGTAVASSASLPSLSSPASDTSSPSLQLTITPSSSPSDCSTSCSPSSSSSSSASPAPQVLSLSSHPPAVIRRYIFSFLQELLVLAKTVQVPLRDAFFRALVDSGLLLVVEEAMARVWREEEEKERQRQPRQRTARDRRGQAGREQLEAEKEREKDEKQNMWLWIACTDIITNLLMHDATIIRNYVLSSATVASSPSSAPSSPSSSLLSVIFSTLQSRHLYLGMGHTLSCIVRLLLDPDMLSAGLDDDQSPAYLDLLYTQHMPGLLSVLAASPSCPPSASAFHVLELLSFCVLQHPLHFPHFASAHSLFPRLHAFLLCCSRKTELLCASVRFLRTCLATKELHYQRELLSPQSPLLQLCFRLFYANQRYNLLNSCLCDLFLLARNEKLSLVMDWMAETEGERLESLPYISAFASLRKDWERVKEEQRDRDAEREREADTASMEGGAEPETQPVDDDGGATQSEDGTAGELLEDGEDAAERAEDGSLLLQETEEDATARSGGSGSSSDEEQPSHHAATNGGDDGSGSSSPRLISRVVSSRKRNSSGSRLDSPPSSSSSSLSIIITKSPTFSLSRAPLQSAASSSSSPGSPPLAPSPSSPLSPNAQLLHRSRSPPPLLRGEEMDAKRRRTA